MWLVQYTVKIGIIYIYNLNPPRSYRPWKHYSTGVLTDTRIQWHSIRNSGLRLVKFPKIMIFYLFLTCFDHDYSLVCRTMTNFQVVCNMDLIWLNQYYIKNKVIIVHNPDTPRFADPQNSSRIIYVTYNPRQWLSITISWFKSVKSSPKSWF